MKAETLINLLKKYPDYEVKMTIFEPDHSSWGMLLRRFDINGIDDIGYSDKIIHLDIEEE
jgi:hypothetical protein